MLVKAICTRLLPSYHCVKSRYFSTCNFYKKPLRKETPTNAIKTKPPTPKPNNVLKTTTLPTKPSVVQNVLAKQIVQNDRLSVQRAQMQPFQRSTNANALYTNLGLKPDATLKDIKSAYYYLAKLYHPDAKSSKDSRQKFLQISEAYAVLSDDKKRLEYNLKQFELSRLGVKGLAVERQDTFNQKPNDTQLSKNSVVLELPFLDAIRGAVREISVATKEPCQACKIHAKTPTNANPVPCSFCNGSGYELKQTNGPSKINVRCKMCRGTRFTYKHMCPKCNDRGSIQVNHSVQVRVPPATNNNDKIQVLHPITGKPIEVTMKIQENEQFRRRGYDVFSNVYVSYSTAVLGGTQTVSSLLGGEMQVQIPAGTETDTNIRLAGKGIEKKESSSHGDHVLVVKIKVPKAVSEKQKSLLAAFATLENHPILETQSNQPKRCQQEAFMMAKKSEIKSKSLYRGLDKPK